MTSTTSVIRVLVLAMSVAIGGCTRTAAGRPTRAAATIRPGITVLLQDSIGLIRGKRIGLITNQTGVDESGTSDIDLLHGPRGRAANVNLVRLFSPEHGIRGTEDHEQIASGIDEKSGLPVISLYTVTTVAPPDSLVRDLDALVYDLQDIGTRTWTYVGAMIYAMHAAVRSNKIIIVLDRPNPITADHIDGPMLDTALSNPDEHTPQRSGKAYALYPFPLRHGMTMGELALFYNTVLGIHANLHVIRMTGYRRSMWFDETGMPWVRPSPNLPTLTSALIYPALVAFEGSNVSVGRGTPDAFQRFGAPWMHADSVASLLNGRKLAGVRFVVDRFTPVNAGDGKYSGVRIPGIRIDVTDRNAVQVGRVSASILWALLKANRDSLKIRDRTFDERFGSTAARESLMRGADPDSVMNSLRPSVDRFLAGARPYRVY